MTDCLCIERRRRHASFSERFDEYIEAIDEEFHLPLGKLASKVRRLSFASIKSSSASISSSATTSISEFDPDSRSEFPFPVILEPKPNTPTRIEPEAEDDDLQWGPSVTYPSEVWKARHGLDHLNERTKKSSNFWRRMAGLIHLQL